MLSSLTLTDGDILGRRGTPSLVVAILMHVAAASKLLVGLILLHWYQLRGTVRLLWRWEVYGKLIAVFSAVLLHGGFDTVEWERL